MAYRHPMNHRINFNWPHVFVKYGRFLLFQILRIRIFVVKNEKRKISTKNALIWSTENQYKSALGLISENIIEKLNY